MDDRIAALRARVAGLAPEQRAAFRVRVEAAGIPWERVAPEAGGGRERPERLPLSPAQMQFWLTQSVHPDIAAFSIAFAWDVRGALDVPAFRAALQQVMTRHVPLRTGFPDEDGIPWQEVAEGIAPPLTVLALPEDLDAAERGFVARPFEMAQAPLWRVDLYSDGAGRHHLFFAFHHIIADGWSRGVFLRELAACYRAQLQGLPPELPVPDRDFADLVLDQSTWLDSAAAQAQGAFWREELADLAAQDLPGKGASPDRRAATVLHDLPPTLASGVTACARSLGVTPFMLLLAVFQLLLHRQTGSDDIAVGTPSAGRTAAGSEAMIGLFVNTLVLRNRVTAGTRFRDWVNVVRGTLARGFAHQDLPFARVVEAVGATRRADQSPLFQTLFQVQSGYGAQNGDAIDLGDPALQISQRPLPLLDAKFDLSWHMMERNGALSVIVEYRKALFDRLRIEDMLAQFETLLASAIAMPTAPIETLRYIPADAALVEQGPKRTIPDLLRLIEAQRACPGPAVQSVAGGHALGYRALLEAADLLARRLRARPELQGTARLGICLPRGADLVIAMLAALKAGVTYVPLDPDHPAARRRAILADAGVGLLLSAAPADAACPVLDPAALEADAPQADLPAPDPDRLAYVIFTSGSTGRPKGVPITHLALSNLIASMARAPGMQAGDRLLAVTTVAFDIAALELLLPLSVGGTVVLAEREVVLDPARLAGAIDAHAVTHMQATPALWRALVEDGWRGRADLSALCGGEALPMELAQALLPRVGALWNMYGPTETTIWSAALQITRDHLAAGHVPVGAAVANTSLMVLDRYGAPLPADLPGELAIGGAGLSPGYWGRPDLSAERFPTVSGRRLYRTGDLVLRTHDGTFRFLGRLDHQIKLNGFRIEPGEVESMLLAQPGVDQALVTAVEGRLVAYLCGREQDPGRLRQALCDALPGYMIPASFIWLDAFPLNPNGKIDRARLPLPEADVTGGTEPETDAERRLQAIWAAVLKRDDIGAEDNFFDLGGASVSAMQIASRARVAGLILTPAQMFEHQTIREQAAVATLRAQEARDILPLSRWQAGTGRLVGEEWHLSLPIPAEAAVHLDVAVQALSGVCPVLGLTRTEAGWAQGHAPWAARCEDGTLHLRADGGLLDAASVAKVAEELVLRMTGGAPGNPEADSYIRWLTRSEAGMPCRPQPIRGDGQGGDALPVPQHLEAARIAQAAALVHAAPAHLLVAGLLRVLGQWQRAPVGIVLIEDMPMPGAGHFTRAVPIAPERAATDLPAALAMVRNAVKTCPPQGADPADLPEGLAVVSWRALPALNGHWHDTPAHPVLPGAALSLQATLCPRHLSLHWNHDPGALRPATLSRLAARVLAETLSARPPQGGSKLDTLRTRLTAKGTV